MSRGAHRPLAHLLAAVPIAELPPAVASLRVRRIVTDAQAVEPGDLFVALRGSQTDGHYFVAEAVARGAVAVLAERDPGTAAGIPVIVVPDTGRALAHLAAAWYDHPARRLWMVGITGSFGKTGTLNMLQAILLEAGLRAGAIGSDFIGARLPGAIHEPALLTTPDPLDLHETLARIVDHCAQICVMEVSSHGLVQERVHGLEFALGIFTCIAPLEHRSAHGSFRSYVEAKSRFFEHIVPGAPVIYPAGERVIRHLIEGLDVAPIRCGGRSGPGVRIRRHALEPGRTRMTLEVAQPIPAVYGGTVEPVSIPVELRLLGRMNAQNAALAATAALCLGAEPEAIRAGLASVAPPPRRLNLERCGRFQLLDDAATHPDSLCILFEVIGGLRYHRLHLVTAIRGSRGAELNRRYAETLAIWARKRPVQGLIVTSSDEAVEETDRVTPEERTAFLEELRKAGVAHDHRDRLDEAIELALDRIGDDDLLVLVGAQGMHAGAELVRQSVRGG